MKRTQADKPAEVAIAAIRNYTPDDVDERHWETCRSVALQHLEPHAAAVAPSSAVRWMRLLSGLLVWASRSGHTIEPCQHLLTPHMVTAFIAQERGHLTAHGRSSETSALHSLAAKINEGAWAKTKTERVLGSPPRPYSESEIEQLGYSLVTVPSSGLRVRVTAVTYAALAAGLSTPDLRHVRPCDITVDDDGASLVHVAGKAPRVVVATDRWAPHLRAAAAEAAAYSYGHLIGENPGARDVITPLKNALRPMGFDGFSVQRLRATWLVSHLETGVPFGDLMVAAGLNSSDSLVRYSLYVRSGMPNARAALRGETTGPSDG